MPTARTETATATTAIPSRSATQGARCSQLLREAQSQRNHLRSLIDAASSSRNVPAAQPAHHLAVDEIDFARKELRNTYLKVLFGFTFNSKAHGVEQSLWRDTTLNLVNLYRTRLSALQKALEADAAAVAGAKRSGTSSSAYAKVAAYKKLADTYRAFLSDEEAFWRDQAGRIVRSFHLHEAAPQLSALGIPVDGEEEEHGRATAEGGWAARSGSVEAERGDADVGNVLRAERLPEGKARLLEIVHKALIFSGDLSRYRELLKDSKRSGAAVASSGIAAAGSRKRGARGTASAGRPRGASAAGPQDFSVAAACYEQARQLLPHNGHPSNQLAVISTYTQDHFSAIYHYYRALCVRVPFDTARTNLDISLRKVVEAWARGDGPERIDALAMVAQGADLSALSAEALGKRATGDFIALLGSVSTRTHLAHVVPFATQFQSTLDAAISARALQTDAIVRMVIIALAASWTSRLWRSSTGSDGSATSSPQDIKGKASATSLARSGPVNTEYFVLLIVLGTFKTLVDVGAREVRSASSEQGWEPAAASDKEQAVASASQKITAVFRRTLPALRLASKWLKSHLEYISRCAERASELSQSSQGAEAGGDALDKTTNEQVRVASAVALAATAGATWQSYVGFCNALRSALPFESLPSLGTAGESAAEGATLALEEDLDVRGFLPTRKGMLSAYDTDAPASQLQERPAPVLAASQVHPNEEQLMRIADLLIDAKLIAESEVSPVRFDDTHNNFVVAAPHRGGAGLTRSSAAEELASATAVHSQPADGTASTYGDDGEDEVILIPPQVPRTTSPSYRAPRGPFATSDARTHGSSPATSLPLLPPTGSLQAAPQPHLLFGGVGSSAMSQATPHASIWAPGPGDLQRLSLGGVGSGSALTHRSGPNLVPPTATSAPWPQPGADNF